MMGVDGTLILVELTNIGCIRLSGTLVGEGRKAEIANEGNDQRKTKSENDGNVGRRMGWLIFVFRSSLAILVSLKRKGLEKDREKLVLKKKKVDRCSLLFT